MDTYIPRPPLSDFVALFWFYQGNGSSAQAQECLLPTGTTELVIDLRLDTLRIYDRHNTTKFHSFGSALLCGPHSESFVIDAPEQSPIIGVHFKAGGVSPFFKVPAAELHNIHVPLDTLWGAAAAYLREQLLEATSVEAKFHILEHTLLAQVTRPLVQHPAVAFALTELHKPLPPTISEVTHQIGLSQRRFIQLFHQDVGLTPKLFSRVLRFQQALHRISQRPQVEWTDLALTCGYFDQAHFIHDFQTFTGLTPGHYLQQRSDHLNHVPLRD